MINSLIMNWNLAADYSFKYSYVNLNYSAL